MAKLGPLENDQQLRRPTEIYLLPTDQIPPTNINQINWGLWEQFYILLHSLTSRRSDWGHFMGSIVIYCDL